MSKSDIRRLQIGKRMSRIVVHDSTVYLCGQVADDYRADVAEQTRQTLAKVDVLLAEAGSSRERMLTATLYLADIRDFEAMNAVWDAWVPEGQAPARACVEARMADPNIRFEISVIAALQETV
jgi:enamine deaminase RidA (YjgF/YER057c/UK114 family)